MLGVQGDGNILYEGVLCASVAGETLPKLATALEYEKLNSMLGLLCKAF